MNFGVNLYNWLLSNAQPLVLVAIVVIGLYLGFKREFTKLIGFLVVAMLSVGLVLQKHKFDRGILSIRQNNMVAERVIICYNRSCRTQILRGVLS